MKSQRKKKLLKTIKNLAIIASITAATLKLSSFFNKQNEIKVLQEKIELLKREIDLLKKEIELLKSSADVFYSEFGKHQHGVDIANLETEGISW